MPQPTTARQLAVTALNDVIQHGKAFHGLPGSIDQRDLKLAKQIIFGTLRAYPRLALIINYCALKPKLKHPLKALLAAGLYELYELSTPVYASIFEAVSLCDFYKIPWAKGLVNAILRRAHREKEAIFKHFSTNLVFQYQHPAWFIEKIKLENPEQWQTILTENNQQAPMTLRVNSQKITRDHYLALLDQQALSFTPCSYSPVGIRLTKPVLVTELPGFHKGLVSVQDEASQLAALFLQPKAGDIVLDACSAPGNKAAILLEQQPNLDLTAYEIDANRAKKITENFRRLQLNAKVTVADVKSAVQHFPKAYFDKILVDAPCSGTGVIRRHPDIKLTKKLSDTVKLVEEVQFILRSLWQLLKPGGRLLYSTCSVFKEENTQQLNNFVNHTPDAKLLGIASDLSTPEGVVELLPGSFEMDGFYYGLLTKIASDL